MQTSNNKTFTVVVQLSDRSYRIVEVEANDPTTAQIQAAESMAPLTAIMTMVSENKVLSDYFPGGAA